MLCFSDLDFSPQTAPSSGRSPWSRSCPAESCRSWAAPGRAERWVEGNNVTLEPVLSVKVDSFSIPNTSGRMTSFLFSFLNESTACNSRSTGLITLLEMERPTRPRVSGDVTSLGERCVRSDRSASSQALGLGDLRRGAQEPPVSATGRWGGKGKQARLSRFQRMQSHKAVVYRSFVHRSPMFLLLVLERVCRLLMFKPHGRSRAPGSSMNWISYGHSSAVKHTVVP